MANFRKGTKHFLTDFNQSFIESKTVTGGETVQMCCSISKPTFYISKKSIRYEVQIVQLLSEF